MTRHVTSMTIYDAEHYTPEQVAEIVASYPPHERDARTKGIPQLGSGAIFPIPEDSIKCEPIAIPNYWACIVGIDFGSDHPTAAVKLAWDRDSDTIYITNAYRMNRMQHLQETGTPATPIIHAATIKAWGEWLPVAWPHDGLQHDKGSGEQLAEIYRATGLNMLPERATWLDGSNGVEAGLVDMLQRMQTGRFKVFNHLNDWFAEFRLYHRKDGKIVKERDDLMAATRYAIMMLRFAITAPQPAKRLNALSSGSIYGF